MSIHYVSDLVERGARPEVRGIEGGHEAPSLRRALDPEVVKQSLRQAIRELDEFFETLDASAGSFRLSEVEVHLQMDHGGKVTLFLAELGTSVSGGFSLRWRRNAG